MFALSRKKEPQLPSPSQGINGRYVKGNPNQRGGFVEYGQWYPHVVSNREKHVSGGIPALEISESYLTQQDEEQLKKQDSEKASKGKRKLPFLQKKKKHLTSSSSVEQRGSGNSDIGLSYNDEDDDDISDITTYAEGIPVAFEGLSISKVNPVALNPYNNTEQSENQYAEQAQIHERLNFIVGNYREPPSYPGDANLENEGKSMIQQLLQEKNNLQIRDNASMINYCQVDVPNGLSMEDLTKIMQKFPEDARKGNASDATFLKKEPRTHEPHITKLPRSDSMNSCQDDKLVMRTINSPVSSPRTKNGMAPETMSPAELYEKRTQYYHESFNADIGARPTPQMICEIYPRDYDADYDQDAPKASKTTVRPVAVEENENRNMATAAYLKSPDYSEHPERDYDLPLDQEYDMSPLHLGSSFLSHFRERSETFVPPSPYMRTDIPEWLCMYASASSQLDDFLKWDMFRIPELDCWQTMLKRLYMKEIGQVVSWFEEYRQSLQHEMERRERELGITRVAMPRIDSRMKKTDV